MKTNKIEKTVSRTYVQEIKTFFYHNLSDQYFKSDINFNKISSSLIAGYKLIHKLISTIYYTLILLLIYKNTFSCTSKIRLIYQASTIVLLTLEEPIQIFPTKTVAICDTCLLNRCF